MSWTHYRLIMRVENKAARDFYIEECVKANWSTRQLEREINTLSYQRYILSQNNHDTDEDTAEKEPKFDPKDIVKAPTFWSPRV